MSGKSFMNGGGESYSGVVTYEAAEHSERSRGGCGGKAAGQREHARAKLVPDTEPGKASQRGWRVCARQGNLPRRHPWL